MALDVRFAFQQSSFSLAMVEHQIELYGTLPDFPKKIRALMEQIEDYLNAQRVHPFNSRFMYFDFRLRKAMQQVEKHPEQIVHLAKKVGEASTHLYKALADKRGHFHPLANNPDRAGFPGWDIALREQRVEMLRQFSKDLKNGTQSQIQQLFQWAVAHWDVEVLCQILVQCDLAQNESDQLVNKAFERKELEKIALPLMLYHFETLSAPSQMKVDTWFREEINNWHDIASELDLLKWTLERVCGNDCSIEETPFVSSKEDLKPWIENISRLFLEITNMKRMTASKMEWNKWLSTWERESIPHLLQQARFVVSLVSDAAFPRRAQKRSQIWHPEVIHEEEEKG